MLLRNTTKMALQASVAILIAELFSLQFHLERGYWITLTAMALTTQTWGESVKRSLERVGMTALGGFLGTILYFILPHKPVLVFGFLLLFVFLTVYMMPIFHLVSVFFLTCFVVFLFAIIGDWDWSLLRVRIFDTAIGAVIALLVGFFFFPLKMDVPTLFINYLDRMKASLRLVFSPTQSFGVQSPQNLIADFQKIKKGALAIRYELLFHRLNAQDFNLVLTYVDFCTQSVVNLIESYQWIAGQLRCEEKALILAAVRETESNIQAIIQRLQGEKKAIILPSVNLSQLLGQEISEHPERFATLDAHALAFYSVMHLFNQLNVGLNRIFSILTKAYR